jgi:hypothetical protein
MKNLKSLGLIFIAAMSLFSSKKGNDATAVANGKDPGSAEEFKYKPGAYIGLQAFTIEMNNDGTLTWIDMSSARPGLKDNQVSIVFPGDINLSADVSDTNWDQFYKSSNQRFSY